MDFSIIEKLNGFNHILFDESKHLYTIGDRKLTSVTTLLKKYETEKDWDEIATKYAIKHVLDPKDVRQKWKDEGTVASFKGSEFHLYAENALANKLYNTKVPDSTIQNICLKLEYNYPQAIKKLLMMWKVFWFQAKENLVPVRSEFIVGDVESGVAGMVDQLFWNKKEQELQIWDWKTNKKIAKQNKYQKLLGPFSHLDECEYNKYSIQLQTYKHIIQKVLGIEIGSCYICWFNENNDSYKIFKTIDLQDEVGQMLSNEKHA